jgi:anaerobic magnesium-protoporphyrin IX monomethyl ester cyclase
LMSLGHPGESSETADQTLDWLLAARPDDFDVTIITTYPGTPYYDDAVAHASMPGVFTYEANGDRLHAFEVDYTTVSDYYKGDPNGGYRSFVFTDFLSCEQLVQARDHVEQQARVKLGIPFNQSRAAVQYEHSMGQRGLPANILRSSQRRQVQG